MPDLLIEEQELFDLDVAKVDLVQLPANRRRWAVKKEQDIGGQTMAEKEKEVVEEVQPEEQLEQTEEVETAEVEKAEVVEEVAKENEVLKDRIVALEKALWTEKKAPVCKDLGIELEMLWKLEQAEPEAAEYFVKRLGEERERVTELMKELGRAGTEVEEKGFMAEVTRVQKAEGITRTEAIAKVNQANPELYNEYVRERQEETA